MSTAPVPALRRLTVPQVIGGLLLRPSATMWKVRDEGPLWLSFVAAWVLGGVGLGGAVLFLMAGPSGRPLWVCWLGGVAVLAGQFLGTMLLIHLAAFVVWYVRNPRDKADGQGLPLPAGLGTLLRLGGYWYLPSGLLSVVCGVIILAAVRSGSALAIRAVAVTAVPLAVAGYIWVALFRLRILRTVYLGTWGQAVAIGLIVMLLALLANNVAGGILRRVVTLEADAAIAYVHWDLHLALGANPAIIKALEAIPMASASLPVTQLTGAPRSGDLVAYYRDRDAPPIQKGVALPRPIVIGRVVAGPGEEREDEIAHGSTPVQVPDGYALMRPAGASDASPAELVALKAIAGLVPESGLRFMGWVTRFLLR